MIVIHIKLQHKISPSNIHLLRVPVIEQHRVVFDLAFSFTTVYIYSKGRRVTSSNSTPEMTIVKIRLNY